MTFEEKGTAFGGHTTSTTSNMVSLRRIHYTRLHFFFHWTVRFMWMFEEETIRMPQHHSWIKNAMKACGLELLPVVMVRSHSSPHLRFPNRHNILLHSLPTLRTALLLLPLTHYNPSCAYSLLYCFFHAAACLNACLLACLLAYCTSVQVFITSPIHFIHAFPSRLAFKPVRSFTIFFLQRLFIFSHESDVLCTRVSHK